MKELQQSFDEWITTTMIVRFKEKSAADELRWTLYLMVR